MAEPAERELEYEYVEYQIDVENGQVVACKLFGEGRQAEPLTKPVAYMPVAGMPWPRGLEHIARRVTLAFAKLGR
jgi:hypothetical protein